MTRKSKPPTNREMREVAGDNINRTLADLDRKFNEALSAYEDALAPGVSLAIQDKLRQDVVAKFNLVKEQLGYLARIRFVERYPDNDAPVKDA